MAGPQASDAFDRYDLLSIPTDRRPPNYYELLGLKPFEDDAALIRRQGQERFRLVHVRQAGQHGSAAIQLAREVSQAIDCLSNAERKQQYDAELRTRQSAATRQPAPPPLAAAPFNAAQAKSYQRQWASLLKQPLELSSSIGMKLVLLPAGEFRMGSPESEGDRCDNEFQHRVQITKPFWLGRYEVTQAEYQRVMGTNPSAFKQSGGTAPVEDVSWNEAVEFCRKLSALPEEQAARRAYRLPTEAEWEYACRAGTRTRYSFGDADGELGEYAWHRSNSDGKTHPVGEKKPNAWGLYDMHGNVWEWCGDFYDESYYGECPTDDPPGPASGSSRVLRGGSWYDDRPGYFRCAYRSDYGPDYRNFLDGFRVARTLTP